MTNIYFYMCNRQTLFTLVPGRYKNIHFTERVMLRKIYILFILANGIMFPGAEKDFLFEKMA